MGVPPARDGLRAPVWQALHDGLPARDRAGACAVELPVMRHRQKRAKKNPDGLHLMGSAVGYHVSDGRLVLRSRTQKRKRDPKQHTMGCDALLK